MRLVQTMTSLWKVRNEIHVPLIFWTLIPLCMLLLCTQSFSGWAEAYRGLQASGNTLSVYRQFSWGLASPPVGKGRVYVECTKYRQESATLILIASTELYKKLLPSRQKGLIHSCLLIVHLPSRSRVHNWHLETMHTQLMCTVVGKGVTPCDIHVVSQQPSQKHTNMHTQSNKADGDITPKMWFSIFTLSNSNDYITARPIM